MRRKVVIRLKSGWEILKRDILNARVAFIVLGGYFLVGRYFLHSLCPSVAVTGFPCPGCGLTRAMLSIFRGNFTVAWQIHPFSYVILLYIAVFFFRRYVQQKELTHFSKYLIALLVLMVLFYIYRMIRYFPGEPPMSYYYGSVLGRMLRRYFGR
ncbi:DUF2752 domain-containing protein [Roseburia hominis]